VIQSRTSSFFDVIATPITTAIALVQNGFQDMLLTENLRPVHVEGRLDRVIDTRWNIEFVHDFPDLTPETIAAVQARYRVRARWFMDLFESDEMPSYFVRRWYPGDGDEDERHAIRLFEVLQARRRDSRLLYLHNDPGRPARMFGAYRSIYLPPPHHGHWVGNTGAWRQILDGFAVQRFEDPGFQLPILNRPRFSSCAIERSSSRA
jgi:GNAT superfamily N-acetyltransferase